MEYFSFLIFLIATCTTILGLFVYLRNVKSDTNKLFLLLTLCLSVWNVTNYFSLTSGTEATTLFWIRAVMATTAFIGPILYLFSYAYPYNKLVINSTRKYFLIVATILVSALSFTPFVFSKVSISDGISPTPGYGILFYGLLLFTTIVLAFETIINKYRTYTGIEKLRVKYLLFGIIITFSGGFFTNFIFVLLNISQFVILGPSFSIFLVLFLSYSIIRHRLMDIRIAVRKTLANLIVLITSFTLFLLINSIFTGELSLYDSIRIFLISIALVVLYDPFVRLIYKITDKFLFSALYSRENLLRDLSVSLNSTIGFDAVLSKIYDILSKTLHIKFAVFALNTSNRKDIPEFNESSNAGDALYKFGDAAHINLLPNSIKSHFTNGKKSLVYDELIDLIENSSDRKLLKLKKWMEENAIAVILPLYIKGSSIGYILLGEKLNGDSFTSEDISVLETFTLQAAIGIENIMLFIYTRDFNSQLKHEVDRATVQLKEKNKTLELLRKMDSIITQTLDLKVVSQKIVDTLSWELGYDIAYLNIINNEANALIPVAFAHSPQLDKSSAILTGYEHNFEISLDDLDNPLVRVFNDGVKYSSSRIEDVFSAKVSKEILAQLESVHDIKGIISYPVYAKEKAVGVLVVGIPVDLGQFSVMEQDLLQEFVKEVGIAVDNAMLYDELKITNQKLKNTNQKLIELDQMKDEFVSIASHELRTPMTAINSYVWMAMNKGGELPTKARDYLDKVAISTQRMISLVEDMLSVSRIESGRIKIEPTAFSICSLIKDVNEELIIKAKERNQQLEFDCNNEDILVVGDMNKVREVITNLIANAIKFTETGGRVWSEIKEIDELIEVSVFDTGKGIAQNDLPRLFTKFGRIENELSTVAQTQGTGLGLYICKKYIEAMGGQIGAESELGKGSRFWFRLKRG